MENIIYLAIILLIIILISVLFNIYLVLIRKKKITFDFIYKSIDEDIEYIFDKFIYLEMLRYALASNSILGTEEIKKNVSLTFKEFKRIYPKNQYKRYNKILNNNLDDLVIKIIYTKITDANLKLKLKIVKNDIV